jgi:outer membrane protein OmpA-like peptidoglycan-associated protein
MKASRSVCFADVAEPRALELTTRRAALVLDWLVERGVARSRLVPVACGSIRPLFPADNDDERAANRRAEIVRHTAATGCEPRW